MWFLGTSFLSNKREVCTKRKPFPTSPLSSCLDRYYMRMQCLALWQPSCSHEGNTKKISDLPSSCFGFWGLWDSPATTSICYVSKIDSCLVKPTLLELYLLIARHIRTDIELSFFISKVKWIVLRVATLLWALMFCDEGIILELTYQGTE